MSAQEDCHVHEQQPTMKELTMILLQYITIHVVLFGGKDAEQQGRCKSICRISSVLLHITMFFMECMYIVLNSIVDCII